MENEECCDNQIDVLSQEKWSTMDLADLRKVVKKGKHCYDINYLHQYIQGSGGLGTHGKWPLTQEPILQNDIRDIRDCHINNNCNLNAVNTCNSDSDYERFIGALL